MALKDMIALIAQVKQLNLAQQAQELEAQKEQRMEKGQAVAAFSTYATIAPNIKDPEMRRQFQAAFSQKSGIPLAALDEMGEGNVQTIAQQIAENADHYMNSGAPDVGDISRRSTYNAMGATTPEGAKVGNVVEAFAGDPANAGKIGLRSVLGTTPGANAQDDAIAGIPTDMFTQAWRMREGFELNAPTRAGLQVQREGQQIQREGQNLQAGIAGSQLNWDKIKTNLELGVRSASNATEVAGATEKAKGQALTELREWATYFSTKPSNPTQAAAGVMAIREHYDTVFGRNSFNQLMQQSGIERPENLDPGTIDRIISKWKQY